MTASLEHRFGPYGGRFVLETLMAALNDLDDAWAGARDDPEFGRRLAELSRDAIGRPSPLYLAGRVSEATGRTVYLKREDLDHTGAHTANNAFGQALLARRMGKRRIIAATGGGQHGVAVASACARLGLDAVVYMGSEDVRRRPTAVARMNLLGARVEPVDLGDRTLREAVSAAMRAWVGEVEGGYYLPCSAVGPAPYPALVRELQRVIGDETRAQLMERAGRLPDRVVAAVGGGSNAIGMFTAFVRDDDVRLVGVEAGGHLAADARGGVVHGAFSAVSRDEDGQILPTGSVAPGLDYPAAGPEHAWLRDTGRVRYVAVSDDEALDAFHRACLLEGIAPALESAHALAWLLGGGREDGDGIDVVCLSGRETEEAAR